jgi:serine phosphatase RsbU (regulator of sigma subunit)
MLFDSPQDGSTLNSRKVHFVTSLATQGSTALETVHLLEREITRHRDLEELATARRIQQNILPTTLPDFPNLSISAISNPAQAVGGDYFNVIPLDDDHVLVIVADVSGKGLPASFYMAELHGMVCIASTTCATPSQMLATINEHLHREMPRGTFITATALLFNTRSRQLSLARAGHTPLIYRNHSEMTVFTPPGPALGFVRGGQFTSMIHEHKISYGAGDTFVLYSDGVSEMMNTYREEFGDQRLHTLVGTLNGGNAAAIRDRIVGEVEEFRDGAEQHDDMTVVVIQINKEVREQAIVGGDIPAL